MRVSTCCCGCSLEQGCKIIAILGLIGGVLGLINAVVSGVAAGAGAWVLLGILPDILVLVTYGLLLWGTL